MEYIQSSKHLTKLLQQTREEIEVETIVAII